MELRRSSHYDDFDINFERDIKGEVKMDQFTDKFQNERAFHKPISKVLPQISGLRTWCPSRKFGHEINLKVLLFLVLLD